MKRPIEENLVYIFRLFVGLEMLVLLMVPLFEFLLFGQITFVDDPFFPLIFETSFLFLYLSIPQIQYRLQSYFLPIAIFIAVLIPSFITTNLLIDSFAQGISVDLVHVWALLPLLLLPLVITAWQYDYKIVFILYGGLGMIDVMVIVFRGLGTGQYIFDVLYATLIRVISLSLVGFMISELMKIQRQQRNLLTRANLRLSNQALIKEEMATMRERNRLGRELHDTLAHTLSGLAVQLEAIKTVTPELETQVHYMLDQALTTARRGLTETRRSLKALRATPLEKAGLEQALSEMAQRVIALNGAETQVHIAESLPAVSAEVEHALYRIAQEALENCVKHAHAEHILFSLDRLDEELVLMIEDDGVGFDPDAVADMERYGLNGMRERAQMVHGILEIESSHESGTRVTFRVGGSA
ncbi:MAG: sensor histidine kinase [Anaerolineaceae bacterium]|nr:sensor histidine kinase [Anaerolineaceae bacterium]